MYIFTVLAILMVALLIANYLDKQLADTLGITCCGFILVLYILAFFRRLSWIDYIAIPILIVGAFWLWRNRQFMAIVRKLFTIQNMCIIFFILLLSISQLSRIATWWDDINFWATDVKALWMLDGFAGKYGNVAPEFGDYPPAIQLFKWFFLHMGGKEYREGLGFSGYLCLNFVLLLPLISRVEEILPTITIVSEEETEAVGVKIAKNRKYYVNDKKLISKYKVRVAQTEEGPIGENVDPVRNIVLLLINILACGLLVLMPTVANIVCFEGTCVDVTMGIVYGMLLLTIWNLDTEHIKFYAFKLGILGSVLVLCKTVGMEWAVMAAVFMFLCFLYRRRGEKFNQASLLDRNIRYSIMVFGSWGLAIGSWMIFCLINRRVANLTSGGIKMVKSGQVNLLYYAQEKVPAFLEGFAIHPMHTDKTWGIDLPALGIFAIFIVLICIMKKLGLIDKEFKKSLLWFTILTAVVAYGIILIGHLTIFAAETQYETGQVMAISISRYGAPYVLGTMILLLGICINSIEKYDGGRPVADSIVKEHLLAGNLKQTRMLYVLIAVFILGTCDYGACVEGLFSYRDNVSEKAMERASMIDDEASDFLAMIENNDELVGKRVLYIRDAADTRWVHNAYINNEAAPVAVVYGSVSGESTLEDVQNIILASHARYLYVDDIEDVGEAFKMICDGDYSNRTLYRILSEYRIEEFYETMDEK